MALTINDPISKETLEKMRIIHDLCSQLQAALMTIEQEKVDIIVKHRTIDGQYKKMIDHEMSLRGIPSGTIVEIDPNTGIISVESKPST